MVTGSVANSDPIISTFLWKILIQLRRRTERLIFLKHPSAVPLSTRETSVTFRGSDSLEAKAQLVRGQLCAASPSPPPLPEDALHATRLWLFPSWKGLSWSPMFRFY